MSRKEKEIRERASLDAILYRAIVCRVALCEGGSPYVVPLLYGYDGRALYLHSAWEGRKVALLRRNPRVCFEVDVDQVIVPDEDPCAWNLKYRSVIGFGRATFLERPEEKADGLDLILHHYGGSSCGYSEAALARVAVVRIEVESLTGKESGYAAHLGTEGEIGTPAAPPCPSSGEVPGVDALASRQHAARPSVPSRCRWMDVGRCLGS